MQYLLAYLVYYGPFALVLLDVLIEREASPSRKLLGYSTALLGIIPVVLMHRGSDAWVWLILLPTQLAVIYAFKLQRLPRFVIWFAGFSFLCMAFGTNAPDLGHPSFRYYEMLFLPMNAAIWINPPLTIWLIWRKVPMAYDALRGGSWATTGVPLKVRYGLLACIVLVSLVTNVVFYYQLSDFRQRAGQEAGSSLYGMWFNLNNLQHLLTHKDSGRYENWQRDALEYMDHYSSNVRDLVAVVHPGGMSPTHAFYFLSRGFPEGATNALERGDGLTAADAERLLAVVDALQNALRSTIESRPGLRVKPYETAVEQALEKLKGTDALDVLNLQYMPK